MKARLSKVMIGLLAFSMLAWIAVAADVSGAWSGSLTTANGDKHDIGMNLKANGGALTGTVTGLPPHGDEQPIVNGKVDGDQVYWETSFKNQNGDDITFKFNAKVTGNQIDGKITTPRGEISFSATKK